ncbi:MAG: glycosyltransferase family 2 protein, partial [Burkholderiales bacterium]
YRLLGVCAARMSHRLGERAVRLRAIESRPFYVHGPARYYYTFRNSLLLYRLPHAPLRWKLADAGRLLMLLGAIAVFAPPRLQNIQAAFRGLADGIRGRAGPVEPAD